EFYPLTAPVMQTGARFEDILRYGISVGEYAIPPGEEEAWLAERLDVHRQAETMIEQPLSDGRWLRIVERAMPDGGRVGLRIDITAQKRAAERLAAIIRGTNAGTWELNIQTGEAIFNERYAEMIGETVESLGPQQFETFRSRVDPGDLASAEAAMEAHLGGESEFFQAEFRMRHREGHEVWILSRGRIGSWTSDHRPLWMYGTHHEITARKTAEAALRAAHAAAEAANDAKSTFLAQMSHEIRTPMNGMLAMIDVLTEEMDNPSHADMLNTVRESGEALMRILNDLLDVSKIEAGRVDVECIPFVPADVAQRIEALHRHAAAEKGLSFTVETHGAVEVPRIGDSHRLLQILHNLISNAIKFTPKGTVRVSLAAHPAEGLVLTVSDDGIGMTPAQAEKIFESFSQADVSTTRRFGGTGLGMAIVRGLVDLMQGRIDVATAPGEGTKITIAVPLPLAMGELMPEEDRKETALPPGLRVMVVDDSQTNRLVMSRLLSQLQASSVLAEDGPTAVQKARTGDFDVIMMDISMPDMDGVTALSIIREEATTDGRAPCPVLAVTANALPDQVRSYMDAGFIGHLAKPVSRQRVRDALTKALQQGDPNSGTAASAA
ncbi:MAG: ATP-binding protein, partial [Pseudomonadota bacterium]